MPNQRNRGRPLGVAHDAKTREKIRTSVIIDKLDKHINGENKMTATQVNAARILLNKSLPDLSQIQVEAQIEDIRQRTREEIEEQLRARGIDPEQLRARPH